MSASLLGVELKIKDTKDARCRRSLGWNSASPAVDHEARAFCGASGSFILLRTFLFPYFLVLSRKLPPEPEVSNARRR